MEGQSKPQFASNEEAYESYKKEYDALGQKYNMSGDDFWMEAETASTWSCTLREDYQRIMSLRMRLNMCKYLIDKNTPNE